MSQRLITAALAAAVFLFAATAEAKHGKMMKVEMIRSQDVTLPDGKKATVYVVKMGDHMMIAIPSDDGSIPNWIAPH